MLPLARPDAHGAHRRDDRVVARLGRARPLRRPLSRCGRAQRARAQADVVRAVGRDHRRADDVAARARGRRPQLGLPVLLAARRLVHGARAARARLHRGRRGVLLLAPAHDATDATRAARALRRLRQPPGDEHELVELAGYHGSRPVRIGNAAYGQLQLDMLRRGDRRDGTARARRLAGSIARPSASSASSAPTCSSTGARPTPGSGNRASRREHRTHSRLMCWVALDRILALQRDGLLGRIDVATVRRAARRDSRRHRAARVRSGPRLLHGQLGPSELDAACC